MKKLFVVSTELEVVVLAETKEDAEKLVNHERISDLAQGDLGWHAQPMMWMPGDWDTSCLPFGGDDNTDCQTIGELIEEGAAPEYSAQLKSARSRLPNG
jgi:hypothetical protein